MKKIISFMLSLLIFAGLFSVSASSDTTENITYSVGDVDLDGDISVVDATSIQFHLANLVVLTAEQLAVADADDDGIVAVTDATYIQLFIAKIIDSLPGDAGSVDKPESVVGAMDNQHTITLYNSLPADTYTLKYEDENGVLDNFSYICSLEITQEQKGDSTYRGLIAQNTAPLNATKIGVYNSFNERVGIIPFDSGFSKVDGEKLYSFGAISDVHVGLNIYNNEYYPTSTEDFRRALTYLNTTENVDFICNCGDLTLYATQKELSLYKSIVDECSADTEVYVAAGNHEEYRDVSSEYLEDYTGHPLYYYFTQGNDVFFFVGVTGTAESTLFLEGELQWLYEVLEENRNKRCFVFEHVLTDTGSGDALNLYTGSKLKSHVNSVVFKSLMSHYKNAVHFHGHSHMEFALQEYSPIANYDNLLGTHSVHIPSLAVSRSVNAQGTLATIFEQSEGYVVDVYENGVHLRGRDFANEKFLPLAQYYLDTTLKTIPKGTFVDSTGTIKTSEN